MEEEEQHCWVHIENTRVPRIRLFELSRGRAFVPHRLRRAGDCVPRALADTHARTATSACYLASAWKKRPAARLLLRTWRKEASREGVTSPSPIKSGTRCEFCCFTASYPYRMVKSVHHLSG